MPEEQQLQAVAEGLAASVLHSSTSNPDLHARNVSHHEDFDGGVVQNNLLDIQSKEKTQVISCAFQLRELSPK